MQMLEDLQITEKGKYILGDRKKSSIRGIVEALQDSSIIPRLNLEISCKLIANRIELELSSKLDYSDAYLNFRKLASNYIKNHYDKN